MPCFFFFPTRPFLRRSAAVRLADEKCASFPGWLSMYVAGWSLPSHERPIINPREDKVTAAIGLLSVPTIIALITELVDQR